MKDIVADALAHAENVESDETTDSEEFGEPRVALLGYGSAGRAIIDKGWDSRYPHPKYPDTDTHHIPSLEALPSDVLDADYAILAGSADDHTLATNIGARLTGDTTSIALPFGPTADTVRTVETTNVTIPCAQKQIRELATDILTLLAGRIKMSPPPRFYHELQTIGRLRGFRGQQKQKSADMRPNEFAQLLISDALSTPIDTGAVTDHFISFLNAGPDVTLRETDSIRTEIANELGTDPERELLAVDVSEDMGQNYRLTMFCV